MNDYIQILAGTTVIGFFPVPLGSSCEARATLYTDTAAQRAQIIPNLPDAGTDYDGWQGKGCAGPPGGGQAATDVITDVVSLDPNDQPSSGGGSTSNTSLSGLRLNSIVTH